MKKGFSRKLVSPTNLIYLGLGCLSIGLTAALVWFFVVNNFKTYRLTLVAGSKDGESYILSKALEQVVEAKNPKIQIEVIETKGTEENIEKLEKGEAQLATAQADIPAGSSARTVVFLYPDTFQLLKSWLERRRKDEADRHIASFINLMKSVQEKQLSARVGLEELDKVFAQAATDLIDEKISQESFRTLSEAYKATRDVIEHQSDLPNEKSDRTPKVTA